MQAFYFNMKVVYSSIIVELWLNVPYRPVRSSSDFTLSDMLKLCNLWIKLSDLKIMT